ncbi:putative cytochrome p450 monooxygenase protein [Botrytis fragariae]|uniref:Putative cytochrome p450 monooxygenase protein n=1 Tax=Botrytis fragariae TaxID=1964551 RepID=A0A8H6APJ1_9HELO|nr:putative cytochrome p450 monooxygenase protein [Botrytis fragariae]KAF5871451.1 putative cytochrome p450 monooxygenase protein [Botrytis fragariae]
MSAALFDESKPIAMSPLFLGALALVILAYFIKTILSRPQKLDFPIVGKPGSINWQEALLEGSVKYPNTPFILPSDPPMVVLPHCTNDEVRLLPEEKVSFHKEIERIFLTAHTKFGRNAPAVVKTVKTDLTRHVASTAGPLQDELHFALDTEFGPCESWTKVVLLQKVLRIVALISGRVFVGRPLSRNEEWLQTSINYTTDCIKAKNAAVKWSAWTRYLVAPFLPEIKKVQSHTNKAAELLKPLIDGCIRRFRDGKGLGGESGDEFEDDQGAFVSWMMKHTSPELRENPYSLAVNQLTLSFASIHTTSSAICHILLDLASHPEFIAPLREEIEQVIAEDGFEVDGSGKECLKKQSLTKLKKLDSLLKESQRLSPPSMTASLRVTTAPLHLSTGHTIPKGTSVVYDSHAVNLAGPNVSSLPHDPSTMPKLDPPNVFSPFRFSSLRETPGNESKYQYVTTSKDSMNFGHGNHACPGRFFAGVELKVVMVELLRNWDFRNIGDTEMKGGERPGNIVLGNLIHPNPAAQLEFKRKA